MQIKTETTVGLFMLVAIAAFVYMSFQIGYFRFDPLNYISHEVYFQNASGLTKKSDVKISGVKVGWVDSVQLSRDGSSVLVRLKVQKKYPLSDRSKIIVKQDGLLGFKYVDVKLDEALDAAAFDENSNGSKIGSQEDVVTSFNKIAGNVEAVSSAIKDNLGSLESISKLKNTIDEFNIAARKISMTSEKINEVVVANENNLMLILCDIRKMIQSIKKHMPEFQKDFLPKLKKSATKVAQNFGATSESVKNAANEINDIARKINRNGFFGSLVDESNKRDFKSTFDNISCCLERIRKTTCGFDNYHEFLFNTSTGCFQNYKTHLDFWIHPNDYYFLMGGTTFSKNGFFSHKKVDVCPGENTCVDSFVGDSKCLYVDEKKNNFFSLNLQAGGYYRNLAMRIGFFESTPGISFDYLFPIPMDNFAIISSFQIYDFTAKRHIIQDKGPQLKWINRMFCTPYFYMTFGLDDFSSKLNRSAFFGFALNFGDTYFKLPFFRNF